MNPTILTAFDGALSDFADTEGLDVAWQNVDFTPTPGDPYLRPHLMEAEPVAVGCGESAQNRHRGIYQVDVLYPAGEGWGECAEMAEEIRALFKRGTRLGSVTVETSYAGPPLREETRYKIPVTIRYRAELDNG